MGTMEAEADVRRLVGAPDNARIFFYVSNDLVFGNTLSVPSSVIGAINVSTPLLILAEFKREHTQGSSSTVAASTISIVCIRLLTHDFLTSPVGRSAVVFLPGQGGVYDVLVDRLPQQLVLPPVLSNVASNEADVRGGATSSSTATGCSLHGKGLAQTLRASVQPHGILEYLARLDDYSMDTLVAATRSYAHEILDSLEQRVALQMRRVSPSEVLTRLADLHRYHYAPLWDSLASTATSACVARTLGAVIFHLLVVRPRDADVQQTRNKNTKKNTAATNDPVGTFDESIMLAANALCPGSTALMAAEDMHHQFLLGDMELGAHRCTHCVAQVIADVQAMIAASLEHSPWAQSVFNILDTPFAALVPGTSLVRVHRALAWRLPSMVDYHENGPTREPVLDIPAFLYGAVPLILRHLHRDAIYTAFTAYSTSSGKTLARLIVEPRLVALGDAWDVHAAQLETNMATIAACRSAVPCPEELARRRTLHSLALVDTKGVAGRSEATVEETRAWHDTLKARRSQISSRIADIEDLVSSNDGLLPPCLKCTLKATREAAHADYIERFTLSMWTRDMGAAPEGVARLVLGSNGEAGRLREMQAQAEYATRRQETSLDCKALMNPIDNGGHGAALGCPMRAEYLGAGDTGGKLDDRTVGAIRWRCTRTLRGFVEHVHPRFAVMHPLDYITLQLDAVRPPT